MTVLLTTQYPAEADQLADRIALLDHGQLRGWLQAVGAPASRVSVDRPSLDEVFLSLTENVTENSTTENSRAENARAEENASLR